MLIKLDIQYGDTNTGSFPSPAPGDDPLDGDQERDHGQTIIDARPSRLRATFSDDVLGVKVSGRIEGDFFTGEGTALTSHEDNTRVGSFIPRRTAPGRSVSASGPGSSPGEPEQGAPWNSRGGPRVSIWSGDRADDRPGRR
jgi:hypothetical protein